jgi:hypothetical protein
MCRQEDFLYFFGNHEISTFIESKIETPALSLVLITLFVLFESLLLENLVISLQLHF